MSSIRDRNSQEMADIQAEYQKKKAELIATKKRDLAQTQDYYNQRIQHAEGQGEAAVNHIRSRKDQELKALADQIRSEQERADESLKATARREAERQARLAAESSRAAKTIYEKQRQAELAGQHSIAGLHEKQTEQRTKLLERTRQELEKLQTNYQQNIKRAESEREQQLQSAQQQAHRDLDRVRTRNAEIINREQVQGESQIVQTRDKLESELQKSVDQGKAKVDRVQQENESKMKRQMLTGEQQRQKLHDKFHDEYGRQAKLSESRLAELKDRNLRTEQRLETEHMRTLEAERKQNEHQALEQSKSFQAEFIANKEAHRKSLERQRDQFRSVYDKTQTANTTSLGIQRGQHAQELAELKRELAVKTEKYTEKKEDPFYKVQDSGSRLYETSSNYIIKARVPDYDRKNVRIKVKDDGAVVSGTRNFIDKVENPDKTVSTNSFQTFKEEFRFDAPVAVGAAQQRRDGDILTVTIPKLVSFSKKA